MSAFDLTAVAQSGSLSVQSANLHHLPLIREAIAALDIEESIDLLLPRDPRMVVSDADCVSLMIYNVLHGRVALYHMADWLVGTDADVLFGPDFPCASFTDTRLAETLDRLFVAGTDDVLSEVSMRWLSSDESPPAYNVHQDFTTFMLFGMYGDSPHSAAERAVEEAERPGDESSDEEEVIAEEEEVDLSRAIPVPRRGHSKDHRPDLLQLVYGLSVQGAIGVPLCVSVLDGNTSDSKANRFHIDRLAGLLPPSDEVTLVADSKLCDATTLGRVLDAAFHFVTLVPRTFSVRDTLVEQVRLAGEELPVLAKAHQRLKSDPERFYRGKSVVWPFAILNPETEKVEFKNMRLLVVASPGLEAREEGALNARVDKEFKKIDAAQKRLEKQEFSCEVDAAAAVARELKSTDTFHTVEVSLALTEITEKRARRGRPRKGEVAPTRQVWMVSELTVSRKEESIERARFHGRHFLLVTDHLDPETWSDERILTTYREQHTIEGHKGFRWLKGPAAVAPMFIKTPSRIAALCLVFILALMVRNYIEWKLRAALAEADEQLPNLNNQPTSRPTAENAFYYFRDACVCRVKVDDRVIHTELQGMRPEGLAVLRLMGWSEDIFTRPRLKIRDGPTSKAGM